MRQEEDERDEEDELAQAGQQEADLGLPQRHKALLAGDLNAHGKDTGHVDAHSPGGVLDEGGIGGEDAGHQPGHQHHPQPEQGGVPEAEGELETERLFHTGLIARAKVEAHDRLAALADALNGHGTELGHAGDDGHGTHGHIAAVPGQAGAEADGEQALGGKHHKGGDAQPHHGQDDPALGPQVLFAEPEDGLAPGEEAQDPEGTHGLAEHRGNGGTPHAHVQHKDEDGVQDDVDDRADDGGQHTDLSKALGGDKGVHAHDEEDTDRAQDIDAAVGQRIGQGGLAGTKEPQQEGSPGIEPDGKHHGKKQQHGKAVADDLFGFFFVALPQRDGRAGRAARADEHGKRVEQHQDGGKQAHTRQRRRANARNMADINTVHDVVQQVDHLSYNGGDHELEQQFFDIAAPHILSGLRHEISPLS